MVIMGSYISGADGVVRRTLQLLVQKASGQSQAASFLVDSGADHTVFSADLLALLSLPTQAACRDHLSGNRRHKSNCRCNDGLSDLRTDGGLATVRGQFAAFTDPNATDVSILGRDVLDHFDVIQSRRRNEGRIVGATASVPCNAPLNYGRSQTAGSFFDSSP